MQEHGDPFDLSEALAGVYLKLRGAAGYGAYGFAYPRALEALNGPMIAQCMYEVIKERLYGKADD